MDPDGDESATLYKQLIDEKKKSAQEGNDKGELKSDTKEKRKLSSGILQVRNR